MGEGIIREIPGDEHEKTEVEVPEDLTRADPFAIAVAHYASMQNPEVAKDTSTFLRGQLRHVEVQTKYLEEEHGLRMAHLRNQLAEENVRRLGLRLRVGFQLFLIVAATVVGAGLLVVAYDAFHSRSVVISTFEIAPGLAAPIPSGRIVATQVLDRLTQLQAATRISAEKRSLSNAWTNEISVEVPETGLSFSQLENALKARFGHDERIDGDVVKNESGGLTLTVRGTGILPKSFTDNAGHLEDLVNQASDYIYGESEPGLFAKYLVDANRLDEAIAFAKTHLLNVPLQEQPLLLNYWGDAILAKGAPDAAAQALPLFRETVRLNSQYWVGYHNIMVSLGNFGDVEGAIEEGKRLMKLAGGRPGKASEDMYDQYDTWVFNLQALRAALLADLVGTGGTSMTQGGSDALWVAQVDVQLHELDAARLRLQTTVWDEQYPPDSSLGSITRALLGEALGDFPAAATAWDAYAKAYADPAVATQQRSTVCWSAVAYEKTGQSRKADAALNSVGTLTFPDCYASQADVLDLRGDWAGAQTWYAKAVGLAPSFPGGYYSWGLALAKHGDLDGAAKQFKDANQKGPHWADPLKAWGDLLAKQGHAKEALAKYEEALKFAPNWKELKNVREALAKHTS
jgi:predicted negative regulator of RcsB-dependent stress response